MKALQASIKPFEAPQRNRKKRIYISMQLSEMHGTLRMNTLHLNFETSVHAQIAITRYCILFANVLT